MKCCKCLWQVLGGAAQGESVSADGGYHMLLGNLCLLGNTLSMAVYYLLAKNLVQVCGRVLWNRAMPAPETRHLHTMQTHCRGSSRRKA